METFPLFLSGLNPQQLDAVKTVETHVQVIAGMGTGKTQTLAYKYAYLLHIGVKPQNILSITFTNKASREMKERAIKMMGDQLSEDQIKWIGTFHQIALRLISTYNNYLQVGLQKHFHVMDDHDIKKMLKRLLKDNEALFETCSKEYERVYEDQQCSLKSLVVKLIKIIDKIQNLGLSEILQEQTAHSLNTFDVYVYNKIYSLYQKEKLSMNSIDFGDMILFSIQLLKNNNDLLSQMDIHFDHILIDEYQDTNPLQSDWLQFIKKQSKITAVGDDDQLIYTFRLASLSSMVYFTEHFKKTQIIKLEQNYRSTPNILTTSNALISHNKHRLEKSLWTERSDQGPQIKVIACEDVYEEIECCTQIIQTVLQKKQCSPNMVAILLRTNREVALLEQQLMKKNIPYQLNLDTLGFLNKKEIKETLSFLQLLISKCDNIAFESAFKCIFGSQKAFIDGMRQTMIDQKSSIYEVFKKLLKANPENDEKLLRKRRRDSIYFQNEVSELLTERNFIDCVERYSICSLTEATLISYLNDIGFFKVLSYRTQSNKKQEMELENQVIRFIQFTQEFPNLESFFEYLTFYRNQIHKDKKDCIKIMTIHQAKGLEFEKVFLLGWNDGTIPSRLCSKDLNPQSSYEEERRVAYVALTRARDQVTILYSKIYRKDGQEFTLYPSHFLKESKLLGSKIEKYDSAEKGEQPQIRCFRCSKMGHIQNECPKPCVVKCFKCNKEGHISSDCQKLSQYVMKCFNCDSTKHFANNCPAKRNNFYCYNCKRTGHYANNCYMY